MDGKKRSCSVSCLVVLQTSDKDVYASDGPNVLCNKLICQDWYHVHTKGYNKLMMRTFHADMMVLTVATVITIMLDELWIAFGTGGNFRFIAT